MVHLMLTFLPILFFVVAMVYSSVGFGGGTSYIALMLLLGLEYSQIPIIGLFCNIIVVTLGLIHFAKSGFLKIKMAIPYLVTSIPFAYLGGALPISKTLFQGILGAILIVASILLFVSYKYDEKNEKIKNQNKVIQLLFGALVGFVSGLVGIGGGIFLSPFLHLMRWARAKEIAGMSALFIFLNSISGLLGQFSKHNQLNLSQSDYFLFFAVAMGGYLGSYLGSLKFSPLYIRRITAVVVFLVGARSVWMLF